MILVEGILILSYAELNPLFDIRVFVDTDDDIRLIRRLSAILFDFQSIYFNFLEE